MPYRYRLEVRQSPVQGRGLFALQHIPKGSKVWTLELQQGSVPIKNVQNPKPTLFMTYAQIMEEKDENLLLELATFAYNNSQMKSYVLIRDGGQYINHNDKPNLLQDQQDGCSYAAMDIALGEELFQNYLSYEEDDPEVLKVLSKYLPQRKSFSVNKKF